MGIETLAAISIGSSVVGGGFSMFGAASKASAASASANYAAAVANNNSILAKRNADAAEQSGLVQSQTNDMKYRALGGKQKAAAAANGVDVNSGSPLDVRTSTAEMGRLDTLTILNNASKTAGGYLAQAMNFDAESNLDSMKAKNAETAGYLDMASSLVGTASSVSDKWIGYKTKGVYE